MVLSIFMSRLTFTAKYFSKKKKRGPGIQTQLPDHGHVSYTRTFLSKHFSTTCFEAGAESGTVRIKVNGTKI